MTNGSSAFRLLFCFASKAVQCLLDAERMEGERKPFRNSLTQPHRNFCSFTHIVLFFSGAGEKRGLGVKQFTLPLRVAVWGATRGDWCLTGWLGEMTTKAMRRHLCKACLCIEDDVINRSNVTSQRRKLIYRAGEKKVRCCVTEPYSVSCNEIDSVIRCFVLV